MRTLLTTIGAIMLVIAGIIGYLLHQPEQVNLGEYRETHIFKIDDDGYVLTNGSQVKGDQIAVATDLAAATSTLGTMVGTTTLYFKATSIDYAGGETEPSSEVSCALGPYLTGAPDGCLVTMTLPSETESSRLWVGTSTGVYYGYQTATSSTLVATTTGLTLGTIPTANTSYLFNNGDYSVSETYLAKNVTSDTLVKNGKTFVHTVTYSPTDEAATAGSIHILNATATGSGTTTSYYLTAAYHEPVTIILDEYFDTGLYVDFDTTADVNVNVSYR